MDTDKHTRTHMDKSTLAIGENATLSISPKNHFDQNINPEIFVFSYRDNDDIGDRRPFDGGPRDADTIYRVRRTVLLQADRLVHRSADLQHTPDDRLRSISGELQ